MIVREIDNRGGVRTVRLVDYSTMRVVAQSPPRERVADAWVDHASWAMGVHPMDRKAAEADAAARGVPTQFNEDGDPIIRNASHFKRLYRAYGMHDKQAYY